MNKHTPVHLPATSTFFTLLYKAFFFLVFLVLLLYMVYFIYIRYFLYTVLFTSFIHCCLIYIVTESVWELVCDPITIKLSNLEYLNPVPTHGEAYARRHSAQGRGLPKMRRQCTAHTQQVGAIPASRYGEVRCQSYQKSHCSTM